MISLEEKYQKEAIPQMMQKFGYKNYMAVPKIEKVVLNCGFGKQVAEKTNDEQKKITEGILESLGLICGQKAILTMAKKSISTFKIRQGLAIGAIVTLRGKKMRDFLERLIHVALPRSRDFQGIPAESFDKKGSLTIGIKEHIAFPEISPEKERSIFGLEISIVTNAKKREEGAELLKLLGFPIKI